MWSPEQSSYLIDTILSGVPFPEIYMRSTSTPAGETRHEVVDGQQRVRSILQFGKNDLTLVGDDDVGPRWIRKSFENLDVDERTAFWDYEVVVRDLGGASDGDIRDLFRRLNINCMVLTDQELKHAKYKGCFIRLMENLADDPWWTEMRIVNPRQVRRMEDVEYISELFIGPAAGPQEKKVTLDDYYEDFEADIPEEEQWKTRFTHTRELISNALPEAEIRARSGKSDFYSLFLTFGNLPDRDVRGPQRKETIRKRLMDFRRKVDQAKRRTNTRQFSQDVHAYADAVTRAATDAARRDIRLKILERLIASAVAKSAG